MKLSDIVRDDVTGRMSHTKLMVLAGAGSLIVAFNRATWMQAQVLSADLMLGLAGAILLLAGSSAGSKYLASKSGVRVDQNGEAKP